MDVTFTSHAEDVRNAAAARKQVALEIIGMMGEEYAKRACPVDTGRLRNSINHATDEDSAYIGTNIEYAPYVELGTRKMQAKPYLRPAVTEHTETYKGVVERVYRGGG